MATLIRTNSNSDDDILTLSGDSSTSQLLFTLTQSNAAFVNELGIFSVDDDLGTVNGIGPSQPEYLQAALTRSQTIFSALPNNGTSSRTRQVSISVGNRLGFYLVPNSTTDTVLSHLAAGQPSPPVFFSLAQANTNRFDALRISELGNSAFTLAWEDRLIASQRDFDDFVLTIQPVDALPLPGTTLQGKQQGELIDLRQFTSSISANIIVNSEAAFHNFVGFYIINDAQGTVIDPLTGIAITPGQVGYAQAAIRQSVFNCDRNGTSPLSFNGGVLLAPYIIANGTPQQLLSQNPNNQSDQGILAYFPFFSANPDGIDHIRLLGDNTFSFEDSFRGGDKDFNDMVVQVNITTSNNQSPTNNPSPPDNQPPTNNPSPPDNQPPANSVPLSQTTSENTPLIFSTANGNPIVISDSDAGTNSLQVTLSATDATLTLSGTTGLSFTSGGNGTTSMTFIGTLADINAALNGLTLTPNPGFSGTTSLTIATNDQGNTGSSGALSDSDTIAVNVTPIPISYSILEFTAANYSAAEGNNGTVNMIVATIQRTGNTAGVTKVELHLDVGSTATPNDYVNPLPIAVAFNEGETLKTIEIPIIGDLIPEGDDTIHLRLANPTDGAILGTQQTAVYTIINDDTPAQGQLQFSNPTFSINETGSAIATITVTRTGGSTGAVSATITPTNGTAIGGASLNPPYDYNNTPITVSWLDGETAAKTVTIPIFNDFLVEASETVNLTLGNPTGGAIIGTQSTATLVIEDVEGLSVVTSGGRNISILPGNGDGTFAPAVIYDMPFDNGNSGAVTVGDWDGDGDNDLADINSWGSISVRLNLGNGIFAPTVSYAVGDGPEDLTHGDLDGDGDLDLATSKIVGGVVVLLNNGDGTFVPSVTYPAGSTPEDITVGDLDGDGDLDLATSSSNVPWLATVLLNNGNGTFAPGGTFGANANQEAINADLDADGDLDLITTDVGADVVSILLNDGNANFAAPVNYAADNWPEEVVVGDLDGDSDLDLASVNLFGQNVSVLLNNGDATFAAAVNYPIPSFTAPYSISLGDFDQDGDRDLVTANYGAGIFVFSNNGNGTFAPAVNYPVTASAFVTVASF